MGWFNRFRRRRSSSGFRTSRRALDCRWTRLRIESLEDRALLTITVSFNAGALTFTGDAGNDGLTLTAQNTAGTSFQYAGTGLATTIQAGITSISFDGGTGNNSLAIIGTGNADTISVNGLTTTFGTGPGVPIVYSNLTAFSNGLVVDGSGGGDQISVLAVSAVRPLNVLGGAGDDNVFVSSDGVAQTGNLNGIAETLTVDLGSGTNNTLQVSDFGGTNVKANISVTQTQITGLAGSTGGSVINYAATAGTVNVFLSAPNTTNDQFDVFGTAGNSTFTVKGNGGNDQFLLGATGFGLDLILGAVVVDAGAGTTNELSVSDFDSAITNAAGLVSATQITGMAGTANNVPITYQANGGTFDLIVIDGSDTAGDTIGISNTLAGVAMFEIFGNGGNDTFNPVAAASQLTLRGDAGTDVMNVTSAGATINITGVNAGNVTGIVAAYDTIENLSDAAGSANFVFAPGGTAASVSGMAGSAATLNFAGLAGPITVDRQANSVNGIVGTFANITSIAGSASTADMLIGANVANTWNITGTNSGNIGGAGVFNFSGIENLTGGTANDSFIYGAAGALSGAIAGGGGTTNTLSFAGLAGPVTFNRQTGTITGATLGSFTGINAVAGSASTNDTLVGGNVANTWNVTGTNTGNIGGAGVFDYSGFENLTGGNANDSFVFATGGSQSGTIAGGGGTTNTLNFSGLAGPITANVQANTVNGLVGAFNGINALVGSASTADTLIGANAANTWNITGSNSGNIGGAGVLDYSSIENLTGGTANDSFVFATGGSQSGTITGGGGTTNTLNFGGLVSTMTVNLQTATIAGLVGTFTGINTLVGSGSTNDSIIGPNTSTTWNILGTNSGNVGGAGVFDYSGIENLTGGTANDTFIYATGGQQTGSVTGGGGTVNTLNFAALVGPVAVNLQTGTAPGFLNLFSGINDLVGSASSADTLTGANTANTWSITGANVGNINLTFTYSGVENLTGGNVNDTFGFVTGGSQSGALAGGGGTTNTLNFAGLPGPVTIDRQTATVTGLAGSFTGINTVVGSNSTADQLVGANAANTWNITGTNAGNIGGAGVFDFSSIEDLTGGTAVDDFVFAAGGSITGFIHGGGGTQDILDFGALAGPITANLQTQTVTGLVAAFAAINEIDGSTAATDTLIGANANNFWGITGTNNGNIGGALVFKFFNFENLTGGTADDHFDFFAGGTIAGAIAGNGGTDNILDFSQLVGPITFNHTTNTAAGLLGSSTGIDFVVGSQSTNDTLLGTNTASTWDLTAANAGNIGGAGVFDFTSFENLTGGTANDAFVFFAGGSVAGTIAGGGGTTNLLSFANLLAPVTVDLQPASVAGLVGAFNGINDLIGSPTAGDTLIAADVANTWNILGTDQGNIGGAGVLDFDDFENLTGGSANDTFIYAAGSDSTGTVTGGGGTTNTLDFAAITGPIAINEQNSTVPGVVRVFGGINKFVGTASTLDTFLAANLANTWNITAPNTGNLGGAGVLDFSGIENLVGGTLNDTFVFTGTGAISGTIDGATGTTNTLDFSALAGPLDINRTTNTVAGLVGLFHAINNVIGSASTSDSLTGTNTASTWNITAANAGNVGGTFTFGGIEDLIGGTANDTFVFAVGGSVTGMLSGGGGTDTANFAALPGPITVNLQTGAVAGLVGNLDQINALVATASTADALIGPDLPTVWNLNAVGAGVTAGPNPLTFTGFEQLTGGALNDVFNISVMGTAMTINGGAGDDAFNVASDAPTNNGNLDGITSDFTIAGGAGRNMLLVSDFGQNTLANSAVAVTAAAIQGFAGATNNRTIFVSATPAGSTLDTRLRGSNTLADTFSVSAIPGGAGGLAIEGNGGNDSVVSQATAGNLLVDGGQGNDAVTLATPTAAGANFSPFAVSVSAANYSASVSNSESIQVNGTNNGRAVFLDSAGSDTFTAMSAYSTMTGPGYSNVANGFGNVSAYSMAGGPDNANINDTAGSDNFFALPTYSFIQGVNYYASATGFRNVFGISNAGGSDFATLFDSAGNETFTISPKRAVVSGTSFSYQINGFANIYANSTSGGSDTANLFDSTGDDVFTASSTVAFMQGTGFFYQAVGFASVNANATAGGFDVASLFDSTGSDTLLLQGSNASIALAQPMVSVSTAAFDFVYATSNRGGTDRVTRINPAFGFNLQGNWIG